HFVGLAVSTLIGLVLIAGPYVLMRLFPRRWWIVATAVGLPLGILYALLSPVLISPLFNTFAPLPESAWARKEGNRDKAVALEKSMRKLTDEAGIEVGEVLVVDASRQSYHSNAYFSGFGPTRRIVLYDNLLEKNRPKEVESVLAHEIGHWRHDHIVKGIL